MSKKGSELNVILRKTWKAYLIEYACASLLLILLAVLYLKGIHIPPLLGYMVGGIALVALVTAEYSRWFTRYLITDEKIVIVHGFIKQNTKNVHFIPLGFVPEINLKQGRLQRLLNYGTIFIHGTGESSFEVKEVDNPQEVLALIEMLIDKNRVGRPTAKADDA